MDNYDEILGWWHDNPNSCFVGGAIVDTLATFNLCKRRHFPDGKRPGEPLPFSEHSKCGGNLNATVTLYRNASLGICMLRWDSGLDLPLETDDVSEAKNAVEVMLKMEGYSYVAR